MREYHVRFCEGLGVKFPGPTRHKQTSSRSTGHDRLRRAGCRYPDSARMIPDLDIYRSAQVLVKHHGEDAPIHAAMRADNLLEVGQISLL